MVQEDSPQGVVERFEPELKFFGSLIPFVGKPLATYVEDVVKRRQRKAAEVIRIFEEEACSTFESLMAEAVDDERLGALLEDIIETSSKTRSERKLRALGLLLSQGYLHHDDAAVDELELMLDAIKDMEVPHIRVLDRLVSRGDRHTPLPDYELASLFRNGTTVAYAILKTLERHGMAGPISGPTDDPDAAIGWIPWDFGILLHERLLAQRDDVN